MDSAELQAYWQSDEYLREKARVIGKPERPTPPHVAAAKKRRAAAKKARSRAKSQASKRARKANRR